RQAGTRCARTGMDRLAGRRRVQVKRLARCCGLLIGAWLAAIGDGAPAETWRPPAGAMEIVLWPANVTIARPVVKGPERTEVYKGPKAPLGIPTTTVFD